MCDGGGVGEWKDVWLGCLNGWEVGWVSGRVFNWDVWMDGKWGGWDIVLLRAFDGILLRSSDGILLGF